ncbi:hypothetical protein K432DRAFT_403301 [Lepidopterella palustris CBS 459.81]|uniref:N-acetylglucosaminylphosphatidylinositol deacetylase n=1 Tax=Lepidopterella palustris CBS 459.81 TaxID=1314670 RepID=A0A8E2JGN8_9PEZI|nr:hypothetical protein K432DRAFT_403301 [Lepidopterella palustris CBS 459.81]
MTPASISNSFFLSVLIIVIFIFNLAAASSPFSCQGGSVYVVAHPDDDLLFQSPDLLHEIRVHACVTTIFLTSGDAGIPGSYSEARESGNEAAYASMASRPNGTWQTTLTQMGGQILRVRTLDGRPELQKVWLRLPDGNSLGEGFSGTGNTSLQKLYQGDITKMEATDGSARYTLNALKDVISGILKIRKPNNIRVQDFKREYTSLGNEHDHPDHLTAARIVRDAVADGAAPKAKLIGYAGYPISHHPSTLPSNSTDFEAKKEAFFAYAAFDSRVCQNYDDCEQRDVSGHGQGYSYWLQREYYIV